MGTLNHTHLTFYHTKSWSRQRIKLAKTPLWSLETFEPCQLVDVRGNALRVRALMDDGAAPVERSCISRPVM